jgi:hypothetical protein
MTETTPTGFWLGVAITYALGFSLANHVTRHCCFIEILISYLKRVA